MSEVTQICIKCRHLMIPVKPGGVPWSLRQRLEAFSHWYLCLGYRWNFWRPDAET